MTVAGSENRTEGSGQSGWMQISEILLLTAIVVTCDAGVLSELDGIAACFLVTIIRPQLLPYVLLVVSGFQDSRGLPYVWWYGGTLLLGGWLLMGGFRSLRSFLSNARADFKVLVILIASTTVYGVVSSYVQDTLGIHAQATSRQPIVVGLLALAMMVIGVGVWDRIRIDSRAEQRVRAVFWLLFLNGMIISVARMFLGYSAFTSKYGAVQMNSAEQLETASALGFPRLTGTYLTPIGYAVCMVYLILIWAAAKRDKTVGTGFVTAFLIVGMVLGVMSLAKSIMILVVLSLFGFAIVRLRSIVPSLVVASAGVVAVIFSVGFDTVLKAFRFASGISAVSYRARTWNMILSKFSWGDWLFGTGLGYWPRFLERYTGFRLSDPHSYLFSVPGTYGILGAISYLALAAFLVTAIRRSSGYLRAMAVSLTAMFFIVDMVSIPYVIGNTPITMLIWTLLSAFAGRSRSGVHDSALMVQGAGCDSL